MTGLFRMPPTRLISINLSGHGLATKNQAGQNLSSRGGADRGGTVGSLSPDGSGFAFPQDLGSNILQHRLRQPVGMKEMPL